MGNLLLRKLAIHIGWYLCQGHFRVWVVEVCIVAILAVSNALEVL